MRKILLLFLFSFILFGCKKEQIMKVHCQNVEQFIRETIAKVNPTARIKKIDAFVCSSGKTSSASYIFGPNYYAFDADGVMRDANIVSYYKKFWYFGDLNATVWNDTGGGLSFTGEASASEFSEGAPVFQDFFSSVSLSSGTLYTWKREDIFFSEFALSSSGVGQRYASFSFTGYRIEFE